MSTTSVPTTTSTTPTPTPEKEATPTLRSPICCVLGHVDSGKTRFQDRMRRGTTEEEGGITQQIGATYFPKSSLERMSEGLRDRFHLPGMLFIDTPGHDAFTNLRLVAAEICDLALVVVDVIKGLEFQTLECLRLLKEHKKPFVIVANKLDTVHEWISPEEGESLNFKSNLKRQDKKIKSQLDDYLKHIICQLAEQEINARPYYDNPDEKEYVSIVPVSSMTGEGMPNVMLLISSLAEKFMSKKLAFKEEVTRGYVMEVRKTSHLGHVANVILANGVLRRGDRFLASGYAGIVDSEIREMMVPRDEKEMKDQSGFQVRDELAASHGLLLKARDIEKVIPGSKVIVYRDDDEKMKAYSRLREDFRKMCEKMAKQKYEKRGVYLHGRSVGAVEAVRNLCDQRHIPVAGAFVGPLTKKNIIHAGAIMNSSRVEKNKDLRWYHQRHAVILSYATEISEEMVKFAHDTEVTLLQDPIIYRLGEAYQQMRKDNDAELHRRYPGFVPFNRCRILADHIYRVSAPIIIGVRVEEGCLKQGCTVQAVVQLEDGSDGEPVILGEVESMEKNKGANLEKAKKGDEVCLKIKQPSHQSKTFFAEPLRRLQKEGTPLMHLTTHYTEEQQYLMHAFPEVFDPTHDHEEDSDTRRAHRKH